MTDHFRYDLLTQQALRGVVRTVLADAAKKKGLPGDHHFYISFDTNAEGVRMSERLRVQYPEQMTIILQHQFWDLAVSERAFEVGLSFGGVPEKLGIPFEAVTGFFDPSVQFGLQFEEVAEGEERQSPANVQDKPVKKKRATSAGARRRRAVATAGDSSEQRSGAGRARPRQAGKRRRSGPPRPLPQEEISVRRIFSPACPQAYSRTCSRNPAKSAKRSTKKRVSRATPSGRSPSPPTNYGARRPSARCTTSASAPNACRSRSCARSA